MNATIRDIAARAGVSPTTVSLAFQPDSRISLKTRERVVRVAEQMNYVPDSAAMFLRSGAADVIGFLITDMANPFYARLIRQAMAAGRARGFETTVTESGWDPEREASSLRGFVSARVRGVLACLCEQSDQSLPFLRKRRIPFVLMDTQPAGYDGPFVGNDLSMAGQMAAEHLVESGCKQFAMLTASAAQRPFSAFVAMEVAFTQTLCKAGIDFDPKRDIVEAGLTHDAGRDAMAALLQGRPQVQGVFCVNDLCAVGAITGCDIMGRKPGLDIAVMGIDDLDIAAVPRIGLTSIRQPLEEIATIAVGKLLDAVTGDEALTVKEVLPPRLIVRGSSAFKSC